jgi:hypothetical protein
MARTLSSGWKSTPAFVARMNHYPIESELERLVEWARSQPGLARPETARLNDVVDQPQILGLVAPQHVAAEGQRALFFEVKAIAEEQLRAARVERGRDVRERAGRYMSSELSQARISPVALLNPLLIACACPSSGSLTEYASRCSYFVMISTLPSLLPPSTMMYSRLGYSCPSTERMVSSR